MKNGMLSCVGSAAGWILALDQAADTIVSSLPHGERRILDDQSHVVDPKAVAVVLEQFSDADARPEECRVWVAHAVGIRERTGERRDQSRR